MEPLTDRHYFVILRGWSSRQHENSPPKHSHNSNTAPEHTPSFEGCQCNIYCIDVSLRAFKHLLASPLLVNLNLGECQVLNSVLSSWTLSPYLNLSDEIENPPVQFSDLVKLKVLIFTQSFFCLPRAPSED